MNSRRRQLRKIFKNPEQFSFSLEELVAYIREEHKKSSTYDIHEKSFGNFDAIQKSEKCGCYFCQKIFDASELTDEDWTSDKTALCPYCGIDSVVQDYNVEITPKLLKKMNAEWFGGLG